MIHPLRCRLSANGRLDLDGAACRLTADVQPPSAPGSGTAARLPVLTSDTADDGAVAGVAGRIERRCGEVDGIATAVELFRPLGQEWVALRMLVTNHTGRVWRLGSLSPIHTVDPDGLQVGGVGPGQWRVLRMSRQKNDVPGVYRPAEVDGDHDQARIDGAEIKAGRGVSAEDAARATRAGAVMSEPFVSIRSDRDPGPPAFFAGVLGQTEHLVRIYLGTDPASHGLTLFSVVCEFDGTELPPGSSRSTHWIILAEHDGEQEMVDLFASLLRHEMGVHAPPPPPPVVYCSWYFYGPHLTQDDLDENLDALRRRPIPIDVLQIDDGWMDRFGDWNPGPRFPLGMAHAAQRVREGGFTPGIWTCPFVLHPAAQAVARMPGLVARDQAGEPCIFPHAEGDLWVLDPTHPDAVAYLREMYQRIEGWGFRAHKLDFLRATINAPGIRFHDRSATRAQAYRRGLSLVRQSIGARSYLLACGGLMEGSIGIADAQRIGSDVKGRWTEPAADRAKAARTGHLVRIKQNVFRNWTNAFWHTDPDALQLRRRSGPFRGHAEFEHLADGSFSDDEAFTCVVNHHLGGGLVCISERMAELDDDRLALLRHAIPSAHAPARILDWGSRGCPHRFISEVRPRAAGLAPWHTLTVCNWGDQPAEETVELSAVPAGAERLAVFEFATQVFLGTFPADGRITLTLPPHASRVLRIVAWDGASHLLLGTDLHLSGGGVELADCAISADGIAGTLDTPWLHPVRLTIGMATVQGLQATTRVLEPGSGTFRFALPAPTAAAPPQRVGAGATALLALLLTAVRLVAGEELPDGRVDIDVRPATEQAVLTAITASDGTRARNLKRDALSWEIPVHERSWGQATLRFSASADCTVRVRLKSRFTKPDEAVWVLYDGIALDGATLRNGGFESAPGKADWLLEEQMKGLGAALVRDAQIAQSGQACVRAWHNGPATQQGIELKAGREAVLTLWARRPAPGAVPAPAAAPVSSPYACTPIALGPAANQGFRDEVARDGAGGWTDEGPHNDMATFPTGRAAYAGVIFDIADPAANGDKGCLVLAAPDLKAKRLGTFPSEAAIDVAAPGGFRYLFLLHALGWAPDDPVQVGRIAVEYADGSRGEIAVTATVDAANWWKPQSLANGAPVWKGENRMSEIGLYLSRFAVEDKPIRRLVFTCLQRAWMVAGLSATRDDIPMPKRQEVSFAFTAEELAARYPAFAEAGAVAAAMRGVAPIAGRPGDNAGRPALWLHGDWNILPVRGTGVQGAAITATRFSVPAFMGVRRASQKSAYAPQPEEWSSITQMWYSVNVRVPEALAGGPLKLRFEAVDWLAAVFIDGRLATIHKGRYSPFEVALPESAKPGSVCNVSIFVLKIGEAVLNQRSPYMLGVDPQIGGITAPVCLLRDTPAGFGRLRITTSVADGRIAVACEGSGRLDGLRVEPVILDADGHAVAAPAFPARPAAATMAWEAAWPDARRWSDEDPYLYTLELRVTDQAGNAWAQRERFGFRDLAVRGRDLLLNGRPVRLFGLSYEAQTQNAWLRSDEEENVRQLRTLKERFGINAVRFHHVPAFPAQLRAADRVGILAINQSGLWTASRFSNYRAGDLFIREQQRELAEWVWRDINHPSTCIWDTANEYLCGSPEWVETWQKLDDIVLAIDRTRPVEQSGSGDLRADTAMRHYHNGECHQRIAVDGAGLVTTAPSIFGEFWIGGEGETRPSTLPRQAFAPGQFNDAWLRSLGNVLTRMRTLGGAGFFPFHQLENGIDEQSVPTSPRRTFAPESFDPKRTPEWRIDPAFTATASRVYARIAGLLVERSQAFALGRPAHRTLFVANDTRTDRELDLSVRLAVGDAGQEVLAQRLRLASGETRRIALTIPAPATAGRGRLEVRIASGGAPVFAADEPAVVLATAATGGGRPLRLYRGSPALASALATAGFAVAPATAIAPGTDPLVIGENALAFADKGKVEALLRRDDQRLLVLAQDGVSFADILGLAYRSGRATYAAAHDRALLEAGIDDYDFPGGLGVSYSATYAVPMPSAQTPPWIARVFAGTRYEDMPCLRYEMAQGQAVFCQLLLEAHLGDDARAQAIIARLAAGLDARRERRPGAIRAADPALRRTLEEQGFTVVDRGEAALAIATQAEYAADPALHAAPAVLICDAGEAGSIDGRKLTIKPGRHFTTLLVSPNAPGLYELTTGHFYPIILAGKFCAAVNPPTLRILDLERSQIAVAGKRANQQYDVFGPGNYLPVARCYEDDGKRRWVTGFAAGEPYVAAMAAAIAADGGLAFRRQLRRMLYGIAAAREVALDGDLQDWTWQGDLNLRNWARAKPLPVGDGARGCIAYLMSDASRLLLACTAADAALPVDADAACTWTIDGQRIAVRRRTGGAVAVEIDGRAVDGATGSWKALATAPVDAGAHSAALLPGFALEVGIPQQAVKLQTRMSGAVEIGTGGLRVRYPEPGSDADTFAMVVE